MIGGKIQEIIFILIVIVLIYYASKWISNKVHKYNLKKTKEGYSANDSVSMNTLNKIRQKKNPSPAESAIAALILQNNVVRNYGRTNAQINNEITEFYRHALIAGDEWDGGDLLPLDFVINNADQAAQQFIPNVDFRNTVNIARVNNVQKQAELATQLTNENDGAKGLGIDAFIDMAKTHTDDPQNTHDVLVTKKVAEIAKRLKEAHPNYKAIDDNAVLELFKPENRKWAESIKKNNRYVDYTVQMGEWDAVKLVAARINDPSNARQRGNLIEAFNNEIRDANGVCATGVAEHAFNCLVLLDSDKRNWDIRTFEDVRNDLFDRSRIIIDKVANKYKTSDDAEMKNVARMYLATSKEDMKNLEDPSPEAEEKLRNEMKEEISKLIAVEPTIDDAQKETIKEYIFAGIQ